MPLHSVMTQRNISSKVRTEQVEEGERRPTLEEHHQNTDGRALAVLALEEPRPRTRLRAQRARLGGHAGGLCEQGNFGLHLEQLKLTCRVSYRDFWPRG